MLSDTGVMPQKIQPIARITKRREAPTNQPDARFSSRTRGSQTSPYTLNVEKRPKTTHTNCRRAKNVLLVPSVIPEIFTELSL
jgi:hypothetical protein